MLNLFPMSYALPGDFWLTLFLQGIGDCLSPIMKFFTWLGYPQAYMILIAIIYWSFDRKLGLRLAIFLPVVASINSILKQAFHAPRPYWLDPNIKAIQVSNGFGMPSGHAQASTVWLYAASSLKRRWFWAIAIFVVLMIGLSRIYLGVHFSSQVLIGWVIGILVLVSFFRYESKVLTWFLGQKFNSQLILISGISILLLILGGVFVFILQEWEMPSEWITFASDDLAGSSETILSSIGMASVAGNAGGFLGVALGALLSHRNGGFDAHGTAWKRLLRSVAGLIFFLGLYAIVMWISPDQSKEVLHAIWRFSGFFIISFSSIFLVPLFFIRVKLLSQLKGS
jgi:membrane-associated phospholipid phosphatase